ncbi:MAG: hypothetical protein ACK4GQ_02385 [Candidatus Hadarchaeales archaeon]
MTMHTCAQNHKWILFTWELSRKAKGRRWFYRKLENLLDELPPKSWTKIGGSVYLISASNPSPFRKLLKEFEEPDLRWFEFKIRQSTAHVCTRPSQKPYQQQLPKFICIQKKEKKIKCTAGVGLS